MGLYEEHREMQRKHNILMGMQDFITFYRPGIISKEINLEVIIKSRQPWITLETAEFKTAIHELELKEDMAYWHLLAQRDEKAKFKGHKSYLYSIGGSTRGILKHENKTLGLEMRFDRVTTIRTQKELYEGLSAITTPIIAHIMSLVKVEEYMKDHKLD